MVWVGESAKVIKKNYHAVLIFVKGLEGVPAR
jgi:hypothetical protein